MNTIYPYTSPIILNDLIANANGCIFDNTLPAQRQAAYWMAERAASDLLETFLLPTIVTGTYMPSSPIVLDHAYVQRVLVVRFLDIDETVYWSQTGTANIYVSLRNAERGIVDVTASICNYGCNHLSTIPYQVQIMYEAGLPTGTSTRPDFLLAMSTYAQIIMNEIIGYGNEAPGDVGVQNYSNQEYRESRVALLQTTFGSSAKANFANNLLTKYTKKRSVGL